MKEGDFDFINPATSVSPWMILLGGIMLAILFMAGCPYYNVYTSRMEGRAQLAKSVASKQVQIQDATGKKAAALLLAEADTIRAHGVARSNQIIGQSLENNQSYLYWLWIDELSKQQNVMYVATENNMPILEAGRLAEIRHKKDTLQKQ